MMSNSSPFQPGSIPEGSWESQARTESLHDSTYLLARTKPWVRFIAVLGFVASLFAIGTAILSFTGMGGIPDGPFVLLWALGAVQFAVAIVFYFLPSLLLWNFGTRIADHLRQKDSASFLAALSAQKSFWKYFGIVTLVVMGIYALILSSVPFLLMMR